MIVAGRIFLPATNEVRVDLQTLLTQRRPHTYSYLDFRRDDLNGPVDYGAMLMQQLRRIAGMGPVTMSHYGFRLEYSALYDHRATLRAIKQATGDTLRTSIPWGVTRALDSSYVNYHTGAPLLKKHHEVSTPSRALLSAALLSDGDRLHRAFQDAGLRVAGIKRFSICVEKPKITEWGTMDDECDGIVDAWAGRRDFVIDWEA